jgi:hypothetical protein
LKYIFVAGAPGSKWSSVVKNIYYSPEVDTSDFKDEWTYYHDASGSMQLMHLGAYFDPGMECDLPESLSVLTKLQAEIRFNKPFAQDGTGVRIIKSHIFSYQTNIDYLREQWPDSPIVLVHRNNDACLGWWVKCGHFDITYPKYQAYYKDLKTMAKIIARQNAGIESVWNCHEGFVPQTNIDLADILTLGTPPSEYIQAYEENDIRVKVI